MPRPRLDRALVLADIRRVCELLQTQALSTTQYARHGLYSLNAIAHNLGWWPVARALALGLPEPQTWPQHRKNREPTVPEPKPKKRLAPSHHTTQEASHKKLAEPDTSRAGWRICIGPDDCHRRFWSPDTTLVRVCEHCKGTAAWQDGGGDCVIYR